MGKREREKDNCLATVSSLPGVSSLPLYKTSSCCEKWRCVCACMKGRKDGALQQQETFLQQIWFSERLPEYRPKPRDMSGVMLGK